MTVIRQSSDYKFLLVSYKTSAETCQSIIHLLQDKAFPLAPLRLKCKEKSSENIKLTFRNHLQYCNH